MPAELEKKIRKQALKTWGKNYVTLKKKWGKRSKFLDAYVYGTLRKTGMRWKPRR